LTRDQVGPVAEPDPARDEMMEVVLNLLAESRGATETIENLLQDAHPE
jgi:hypothetical protein